MSTTVGYEKMINKLGAILCRKKPIPIGHISTQLKRSLNIVDLTFLSIGSIIGSGIFVLTGHSVRELAGPAMVLSFLVAGLPSIIAALCYAEFGARVPKAGSTYDFIYVSLGEFWAALVGWNLITSPVFTGAAMSKAWSAYFDTMLDGWIANHTKQHIGEFHSSYLSHYPDFFAAALVLFVCVVVASGAKISTHFNNIFAILKLLVIGFIVCYGFTFANGAYWTDPKYGGFMPFGFSGVMAAAPTAFYAYSGFEQACIAGEEARNPKKQIVWAIVIAFVVSAIAYILMCTALTLMVPYQLVSETSSFADAFAQRGAPWAKYVVAIGALSGLTNVLFGSVFPVPRYVYAVASDGLFIQCLSTVNKHTKVPVRAVLVYAVVTVLAILLFNVNTLVDFLSMGGLLCNTLVSAGIIILRYTARDGEPVGRAGLLKEKFTVTILGKLYGRYPPGAVVVGMVTAQAILMTICSAALVNAPWDSTTSASFVVVMITAALTGLLLILIQLIIMTFQQNDERDLWFKVPLVPFLPSVSMFINVLMIMELTPGTWLWFAVYLIIGTLNYIGYGIRHSKLGKGISAKVQPESYGSIANQNTHL